MKANLITAAKTAAVLALIVVVVTGAIQLATSTRDEGPEALRTLINDATMFHQKIEGSPLFGQCQRIQKYPLTWACGVWLRQSRGEVLLR